MEFNALKKGIAGVKFETVRADKGDYFEAVLTGSELGALNTCLQTLFGPPLVPSATKLSADAQKTVAAFGGIMPGQTLYLASGEKGRLFAMLWPWQDGTHITLKAGAA